MIFLTLRDIAPDKLTEAQLDRIANHLIEKALAGKPPEMIEEAKRRIAAGESVTVESLEAGGRSVTERAS